MAKKSKNKAPRRKKAPKVQQWPLTDTQKVLLSQMLTKHQEELAPLQAYQQNQGHQLLLAFAVELGIDKDLPITYINEAEAFVEKTK